MNPTPVIAIFDVGKTNKKLFLFDEQYRIVYEENYRFDETKDEDGFVCEDVAALTKWIKGTFNAILEKKDFHVKAVNFSAYGASFVYLDRDGKITAPLYNYLKPYPPGLQKKFYDTYGGESIVTKQTASPVLGNLNSGMQLYRLKYEKPELFKQITFAFHLPQYLSYIISDYPASEITSIGCHTNLWDFRNNQYHSWVIKEGIEEKFPPILGSAAVIPATIQNKDIAVGIGLHDSSAALIPYLSSFRDPFILLSTGTWCISLNPFNHSMLSDYELHHDCLCYLSYEGKPVKASRLFAGYEHEQQVKRLAIHFKTETDRYKKIRVDTGILKKVRFADTFSIYNRQGPMVRESKFGNRDLNGFANYEEAYHQLIIDIVEQQIQSTNLVLKGTSVKKIFVDGGFSRNPVYMNLLTMAFPSLEIYAASVPEATALGAAMAIHKKWNNSSLPADIIRLKLYGTPLSKMQ